MCGIAGFLDREDSAIDLRWASARLHAMASAIAHRGPDDEAAIFFPPIGFAHRRLSVIDPTPHGRQPMQRGRLTLTYNGEIYNYREVRAELQSLGVEFKTATDTEVLLAAWERWGQTALDRMNGMFAFAMWDSRDRTLWLARDRLGKKPLYYASHEGLLLFGSEIKAILSWPSFRAEADLEAIHHYLSLQYVPAPMTAFKGVRALPPATLMAVADGREATLRKYWRPPAPQARQALSAAKTAEAEDELRALLRTAVQRRMVADVPVGAFLSGGVDSSAVVTQMAALQNTPIRTFSIGFDEPDFDERSHARVVAAQVGAEHHEEVVRPDAAAILPELAWHYDQPFADPSAVPTYYVSRLARQFVTVTLTGDGGDELFMGYERYRDCDAVDRLLSRLPKAAIAAARAASNRMPPFLARRRPFRGLQWRLQQIGATRAERYEHAIMYFSEREKADGYGEALKPFLRRSTLALLAPYLDAAPTSVSGAAWADLHTYLPDDLLVKVDVASMAFGLESRAPFLDFEFVEWACRLPEQSKTQNGDLKILLRNALRAQLPAKILDRPKMGFGVPIERWFREDLRELAADTLGSSAAKSRGLFRQDHALTLLAQHTSGRRLHHTRLWALLMLELWFQTWIDGPPASRKAGLPV